MGFIHRVLIVCVDRPVQWKIFIEAFRFGSYFPNLPFECGDVHRFAGKTMPKRSEFLIVHHICCSFFSIIISSIRCFKVWIYSLLSLQWAQHPPYAGQYSFQTSRLTIHSFQKCRLKLVSSLFNSHCLRHSHGLLTLSIHQRARELCADVFVVFTGNLLPLEFKACLH